MLFKTGVLPVSTVMLRLFSGYAVSNETEVSYDLHGIRLRVHGVHMRFNLVLFVLVLEIRIL
jgi:hypothetical protein